MAIRFSQEQILSGKRMIDAVKKQAEVPELEPRMKGAGRPASGKETVTLRLDARVVAYYKTFGDDWRLAMSDDLKKASHS